MDRTHALRVYHVLRAPEGTRAKALSRLPASEQQADWLRSAAAVATISTASGWLAFVRAVDLPFIPLDARHLASSGDVLPGDFAP